MKDFNIHEWQAKFIREGRVNGYQVVFHDYSGEGVPYTEHIFDSEIEADKWAMSHEYEEEVEVFRDGDYRYEMQTRYYNPQEKETAFGYHVEKV
jgi:hypothetical protein